MYAIMKTGGKQYRVAEGDTVKVERLSVEQGAQVHFNEILLVANGESIQVGQPFVSNAMVQAEVVDHGRGPKIRIIKLKRRKHYMKHQGHRQDFTKIKIVQITA